jgi:hypothetical protein
MTARLVLQRDSQDMIFVSAASLRMEPKWFLNAPP